MKEATWTQVREALTEAKARGRGRGLYISAPDGNLPRALRDNNGWVMAWKPKAALQFVKSSIN